MSNGATSEKDLIELEIGTFTSDSPMSSLSESELGKTKRVTKDSEVLRTTRVIFAIISHILLLIFVGEPFFILKPPFNDNFDYSLNILFKWHVCLSVIGVATFTESLWVFNSSIGLFPYLAPESKFKVHLFISLITCFFLRLRLVRCFLQSFSFWPTILLHMARIAWCLYGGLHDGALARGILSPTR
eukprot:TRINITY_DN19008_c0_g1_i1.p1 TRINITY_DN19008_c0_g1~~TRINITY_DN19008_c0_g1_i1.p1  ORF type:complete len:196 (+),score=24.13 TRINITY_DN19008_c0_g1_i1:28-588(+)